MFRLCPNLIITISNAEKQVQSLYVPLLFHETFRHVREKLTTDFYKTEKSGEKDYSTELQDMYFFLKA